MYLINNELVIRNATIYDVQTLCTWWADGQVMAHAGFPNGVYTDSDKLMNSIRNETDVARRLIIEIDSKSVGEMNYSIKDNIAEIGIKICDFTYQEKGYGTKALKMLIIYLFDELKVEKIILDTNINNTRAQHVYEKLGFKKITTRFNSFKDQLGIFQSSIDFEISKQDFLR
ncbi:N-acetyltransferase [Clostridium zeae]|uniref:N-acetyltransferase n=1 Tax=Clostridium zeae TaxID=2759022 RepID=A0ABQ1EIN2_9CLOT|nr:GNAT family protein [Clostridium zeae]GFZ34595.1 N-acetyltransferase [Clostridium zeae]